MGNFKNVVGNTLGALPRWVGSGGLVVLDSLKTVANTLTDVGTITKETGNKLFGVLSSSWSKGKWYNKLYQVPAGVVIGAWTAIEWLVRTALEPSRNAILNVRDLTGNFFKNIGNTIGSIFSKEKPVSDFSFAKLKMKEASKENRFSHLAWRNKHSATTPSSHSPDSNSETATQLATLSEQVHTLQASLTTLQSDHQKLQLENEALKKQIADLLQQTWPQQSTIDSQPSESTTQDSQSSAKAA